MRALGVDVDAVTALVTHVAATLVTPRFRMLEDGDVGEKGPGDLVTVVDREAEAALTEGLTGLAPGVPVVGEEAAAEDPRIVDAVRHAPAAWTVDPLDGTRAFVEGTPDYAVMVGLVVAGEAVAGWIHLPEHGLTLVAERGSGATRDGAPWSIPAAARRAAGPRMEIAGRYLGGPARRHVRARLEAPDDRTTGMRLVDARWAGREYARLATGEIDAILSWRTWPWDHVPGAAIVRELGGVSRRLDGSDYRPDTPVTGLLTAASDATAGAVTDVLGLADLPR